MCKSKAHGGQRCSAHARGEYEKALAHGDLRSLADASVAYASTPGGQRYFNEQLLELTSAEEVTRVQMILQEGEALRVDNAKRNGEARGARGEFSSPPTEHELNGFMWSSLGSVESHAMAITRAEVADIYGLLREGGGEGANVTNLRIQVSETPHGYRLDTGFIAVDGEDVSPGTAEYDRLADHIVESAEKVLSPEAKHQLTGRIGQRYGEMSADDLDRVRPSAWSRRTYDKAANGIVAAQKMAIAHDMPEGVEQIEYSVRRHSNNSTTVDVTQVVDAAGDDATAVLSTEKARDLIRNRITDVDPLSRFQAAQPNRSVRRSDADWTPDMPRF